jgi:hypothetical protein
MFFSWNSSLTPVLC